MRPRTRHIDTTMAREGFVQNGQVIYLGSELVPKCLRQHLELTYHHFSS